MEKLSPSAKADAISHLPVEILDIIFDKISDLRSLIAVSQTCKNWRWAVNEHNALYMENLFFLKQLLKDQHLLFSDEVLSNKVKRADFFSRFTEFNSMASSDHSIATCSSSGIFYCNPSKEITLSFEKNHFTFTNQIEFYNEKMVICGQSFIEIISPEKEETEWLINNMLPTNLVSNIHPNGFLARYVPQDRSIYIHSLLEKTLPLSTKIQLDNNHLPLKLIFILDKLCIVSSLTEAKETPNFQIALFTLVSEESPSAFAIPLKETNALFSSQRMAYDKARITFALKSAEEEGLNTYQIKLFDLSSRTYFSQDISIKLPNDEPLLSMALAEDKIIALSTKKCYLWEIAKEKVCHYSFEVSLNKNEEVHHRPKLLEKLSSKFKFRKKRPKAHIPLESSCDLLMSVHKEFVAISERNSSHVNLYCLATGGCLRKIPLEKKHLDLRILDILLNDFYLLVRYAEKESNDNNFPSISKGRLFVLSIDPYPKPSKIQRSNSG